MSPHSLKYVNLEDYNSFMQYAFYSSPVANLLKKFQAELDPLKCYSFHLFCKFHNNHNELQLGKM